MLLERIVRVLLGLDGRFLDRWPTVDQFENGCVLLNDVDELALRDAIEQVVVRFVLVIGEKQRLHTFDCLVIALEP